MVTRQADHIVRNNLQDMFLTWCTGAAVSSFWRCCCASQASGNQYSIMNGKTHESFGREFDMVHGEPLFLLLARLLCQGLR